MIVWAGQNGDHNGCPNFSDGWVLSNANDLGGTPNWTQLSTSGRPPAGQQWSTAVYDSVNSVLTVFGGIGIVGVTCGPTNAVWALSNANGTGGTPTWINLVPQGAPAAPSNRYFVFGIYEPDSNTMTIFGGVPKKGLLNDTWVLSHANGIGGTSTWTQLRPAGQPSLPVPRGLEYVGGFDNVNNRMIMFGGGSFEGPVWSTWVLTDPSGQ
jgi:hypothetical protein